MHGGDGDECIDALRREIAARKGKPYATRKRSEFVYPGFLRKGADPNGLFEHRIIAEAELEETARGDAARAARGK